VKVTDELVGTRLDQAVASRLEGVSRARVRRLIDEGAVTVSGSRSKPSHRLKLGEFVTAEIPAPVRDRLEPEPIPLDVVYEDLHLVVVNKPAGLVVHPASSHREGTLVHALLHHCTDLSGIGGVLRPGIVHRLDKGTSGLLVVAKTDAAHRALQAQFKAHTVDREYLALVRGVPGAESGSIDAPIGRRRSDPKRFTARPGRLRSPRAARTHWRLERRFREFALLRVRLETGRTHQIRVHLASVGLPVAGDPVYGGGRSVARELGLGRQALHAAVLGFEHPELERRLRFEAPIPADLARVLEALAT
jgi:23S rRNA pseudouridine1911/1915/1917 synthase